jgi:hypothetical protein
MQCCGARAESRGAEIKLPPRAGAEITNCGTATSSCSFPVYYRLEEVLKEKNYG